ncbi:hypothetical protein FB567DRAFT_146937 [Paraphoma chrysanthemicola]|uniref:3'-5' exonuclease domain-containing protein n=1 Tax=Paraphoma chrysanthemicola TaxID=798071 RepID=A0A8K0QYP1_9PLEO|nr:hypothetical protein FB567DRAFT_146937 [Paraphoma chrysanthemicola]
MLLRRRAFFSSASCPHRRASDEIIHSCALAQIQHIQFLTSRPIYALAAMNETPRLTTATPSPTTACRWKRGRPVPARYNGGTIQSTIPRTPPWEAENPQAGSRALGAYAQYRCSSTMPRPGSKDNRITDGSIAYALQQMHLGSGSGTTPFTPTASMHAQLATSPVTSSEPLNQVAINDGVPSDTAAAKNVEDAPGAQPSINMESSNSSEYSPSQQESVVLDARGEQEENKDKTEESTEEEMEEHKTLNYQIPEDVLRAAMLASPNTRASFWSAKLYRGPDGESLSTHYCRSSEVAERVAQKFLGEKVVGFDIEWRPFSHAKNIKQNASLIQLACENRIALFHVALFDGSTPSELVPPSLKIILESPDILKVGVAVKGDFSRLQKYLDVQAQGVFELSRLHNLVELHAINPDKVSNKLVGLAAQVLQHLQLPLYKGAPLLDDPEDTENVRESDWSKPLNLQQIHYAAADAYAGFRLYHILEWKRKQLRPTPPTRGLCDYDAKAVPKPKAPKKKKTTSKSKETPAAVADDTEPVVEQDQDEAEEDDGYETAPEELMDSHDLEDSGIVSLADSAANTSGDSSSQRRVGRLNLAWQKGPDPAYPILPEQQADSREPTPSPSFSYNTTNIEDEADGVSRNASLQPRFHDHADSDEFADPELEAALQILEVDADGKLTELTSPTAGTALDALESTLNPNSSSLRSTQGATKVDLNRGKRSSIPTNEVATLDVGSVDLDAMDSEALKFTPAPPPTFEPLAMPNDGETHSPEYNLATTWAREYLKSTIPSPTSTAPSRIRATVPHLRAYHLWHRQNLPLNDIASHLRDPPLSHSTVAGYVLQAVTLERLDYDKETMREVMLGMPTALRKGRWKWMAEKVGALR